MSKRYATIDIGTNTILMLIAEKSDNPESFLELIDEHEIARLGEGFATNPTKFIIPPAKERAIKILKRYRELCDEFQVEKIFAVGTSALREATNGQEITKELSSIIKTEIELIPGEKEAEFSFKGAVSNNKPSIVIDIGGGSTEIISGEDGKILKRISIPIGAVKLTEQYFNPHPTGKEKLKDASDYLDKIFFDLNLNFNAKDTEVFAVAGTPTTLAAVDLGLDDFQRNLIEGHKLSYSKINELFELFNTFSISDIIEKYKVHPNRADVITAGTLILKKVMKKINSNEIIASTKGIRYGMMKYLVINC